LPVKLIATVPRRRCFVSRWSRRCSYTSASITPPSHDLHAPTASDGTWIGRAQQIVVDYLHSELDSRIDLEELAALVDMTANVFLSAFSAAFGTTPHQYLIEQRIERAKALLWGSRASITNISASVGFSNPSHFATTFKQRVGVTPTAYRRHTS